MPTTRGRSHHHHARHNPPPNLDLVPFLAPQSSLPPFLFHVSVRPFRYLNSDANISLTPWHPTDPTDIIDTLQHLHSGEENLSQGHANALIFWYKSYAEAADACSRLRAKLPLYTQDVVQMAVFWAKGARFALYDVEEMARKLGRHGVVRRATGRLYSLPVPREEVGRVFITLDWTDNIVYVPGLNGHVKVPKHVLDQRREDGEAVTWGKLARGLLEEVYLACGRTDLARCDVLLKEMMSGHKLD